MIRAGTEVHLRPGSYHLMFINLNGQVKVMNSYKVNFIFENSGSVMIDMPILEKKFKVDYSHNHKH
jgi:copper(I)-binding protein